MTASARLLNPATEVTNWWRDWRSYDGVRYGRMILAAAEDAAWQDELNLGSGYPTTDGATGNNWAVIEKTATGTFSHSGSAYVAYLDMESNAGQAVYRKIKATGSYVFGSGQTTRLYGMMRFNLGKDGATAGGGVLGWLLSTNTTTGAGTCGLWFNVAGAWGAWITNGAATIANASGTTAINTTGTWYWAMLAADARGLSVWLFDDNMNFIESVAVAAGANTYTVDSFGVHNFCHANGADNVTVTLDRAETRVTSAATCVTSQPVNDLVIFDSGADDTVWDMSTIDLLGTSLASKYGASNTNPPTLNGSYLSEASLQAESDPTGRYFYMQVSPSVSDGTIADLYGATIDYTVAAGGGLLTHPGMVGGLRG